MRGIILAGGTGSRLGVLTKTLNKHVLPVGDVPMILHPLKTLLKNGIDDITVVSTPQGIGQIGEILGSGSTYNCCLTYRVQDRPGGIVQALAVGLAVGLDDNNYSSRPAEPIAAILGDNVFLPSPVFADSDKYQRAAKCFLSHRPGKKGLEAFGVPSFDGRWIVKIIEKPIEPPSEYALTGLYIFGAGVVQAIRSVGISARGETEITDLLNLYASANVLSHEVVTGFWGDAGTVSGMLECSLAVMENKCES